MQPILYKISLSFFSALKAGNLKNPGNKLSTNGYIIDRPKLIKVFVINILWVFIYTPQKHEMQYQKNNIKIKLILKNIDNFIYMHFISSFDFFFALEKSFSCFNSKICSPVKDNFFNKKLITDKLILNISY